MKSELRRSCRSNMLFVERRHRLNCKIAGGHPTDHIWGAKENSRQIRIFYLCAGAGFARSLGGRDYQPWGLAANARSLRDWALAGLVAHKRVLTLLPGSFVGFVTFDLQ